MPDISRKSFIKASVLKDGDVLDIVSAGAWVKKDFSKAQDGSEVKEVFEIRICLNGGENSEFILNRTSMDSLAEEWSCNTDTWIGKKAGVTFVKMMAFGKMAKVLCLIPNKNTKHISSKDQTVSSAERIFEGTQVVSKKDNAWDD